MNILLTGSAGFIGFHVAKKLLSEPGNHVTIIDNINDYYDVSLKQARLEQLQGDFPSSIAFYQISIEDRVGVEAAFSSNTFDVVIHLAAQAGVRYAKENPAVYISSNIDGFFNVIDLARLNRCKLFIYASSSSVYGANKKVPFSERDTCAQPMSLYAASKLADEMIAESYKTSFGMSSIGLRFFNVYGAWGRPDAAYFKWSNDLVLGNQIELRDNGELFRDMTYVDDVAESIRLLIEHGLTLDKPQHDVFNIGNEAPVKIADLLDYLKTAFPGNPPEVLSVARGSEEPVKTWANTNKLKRTIGFVPQTDFQAGIDEFCRWYKSYYRLDHNESTA